MNKQGFPTSWDEIPVVIDLQYVAKYLVCHTYDWLRKEAMAGRLPAYKEGRKWMIEKDDLRDWMRQQRTVKTA